MGKMFKIPITPSPRASRPADSTVSKSSKPKNAPIAASVRVSIKNRNVIGSIGISAKSVSKP